MPTYVYHCSKCNKKYEEFHGMNETSAKCPRCSSTKVKRIPAYLVTREMPNFILYGPGFYKNDYSGRYIHKRHHKYK